ncbi:MAG: hypothetical protein RSA65_09940 [Clostridia bacterium]
MNNPIYAPKGRAKEYGDYALNIYTGCPHGCYYCFAPGVLCKDRERFHADVRPRDGLVEATKKQLASGGIKGKTIHLCFTCDPYPAGIDTSVTRKIIKAIKDSGNHVQLLTKAGQEATRDLDLLDCFDWFGVSYAGYEPWEAYEHTQSEPNAAPPAQRLAALEEAHKRGVRTWISLEPVLNARDALSLLELPFSYIDRYKIGKLNHHLSTIDWKEFGHKAEEICKRKEYDYYIKDDLRKEMEILTE